MSIQVRWLGADLAVRESDLQNTLKSLRHQGLEILSIEPLPSMRGGQPEFKIVVDLRMHD